MHLSEFSDQLGKAPGIPTFFSGCRFHLPLSGPFHYHFRRVAVHFKYLNLQRPKQ